MLHTYTLEVCKDVCQRGIGGSSGLKLITWDGETFHDLDDDSRDRVAAICIDAPSPAAESQASPADGDRLAMNYGPSGGPQTGRWGPGEGEAFASARRKLSAPAWTSRPSRSDTTGSLCLYPSVLVTRH